MAHDDPGTEAEMWRRYNAAYLMERYAWAERLLSMVVEYGHELEPHIDPTLRPVWKAALRRAWPEDGRGDRAGHLPRPRHDAAAGDPGA